MKLSCADKNFISYFLNVEGFASVESDCRSYAKINGLVFQCSEELKETLSREQLHIYEQELENRHEAEDILKRYYFSTGLKMYSHITEITDNPSMFIDAIYGDSLLF